MDRQPLRLRFQCQRQPPLQCKNQCDPPPPVKFNLRKCHTINLIFSKGSWKGYLTISWNFAFLKSINFATLQLSNGLMFFVLFNDTNFCTDFCTNLSTDFLTDFPLFSTNFYIIFFHNSL